MGAKLLLREKPAEGVQAASRQVGHTCAQLGAWSLTGLLEGEGSPGAPAAALLFLGTSTCQLGSPGATPGLSHPLGIHSPSLSQGWGTVQSLQQES